MDVSTHGQGVPQDYSKALKWTRKAADQGDLTAQFGLGLMYELGKGTPQNNPFTQIDLHIPLPPR